MISSVIDKDIHEIGSQKPGKGQGDENIIYVVNLSKITAHFLGVISQ